MSNICPVTLKDVSVNVDHLKPPMAWALFRMSAIMREKGLALVVTSGNDGTHLAKSPRHPRSLHYEDLAVDVRLPTWWGRPVEYNATIRNVLAEALGPEYDVVLESNHFHVEYDPKPFHVA